MYQTSRIHLMSYFCHLEEVTSGRRFISQGPHQDTRIVFLSFNHADHTGYISQFPCWIIGNPGIISCQLKSMTLQVCLINYIHTILIAKIIQIIRIWIMTGTDCIYIKLFHQDNVFFNLFFCYYTAISRIIIMAVHTFKFNGNTIYQESISVQTDISESYILWDYFNHFTIFFHSHEHFIKIWCFCCPVFSFFYSCFKSYFISFRSNCFFQYRYSLCIQQFKSNLYRLFTAKGCIYGKKTICICIIQISFHFIIIDTIFRHTDQFYITEDTALPPHILIFQICSVRPLVYANSNIIFFPYAYQICNIKFCFISGSFAVANFLSVNPQMIC